MPFILQGQYKTIPYKREALFAIEHFSFCLTPGSGYIKITPHERVY